MHGLERSALRILLLAGFGFALLMVSALPAAAQACDTGTAAPDTVVACPGDASGGGSAEDGGAAGGGADGGAIPASRIDTGAGGSVASSAVAAAAVAIAGAAVAGLAVRRRRVG